MRLRPVSAVIDWLKTEKYSIFAVEFRAGGS